MLNGLSFPKIEVSFTKTWKQTGISGAHTHLDKIWEPFLTGWAGEVAIIDMNGHMIFQQIKAVKGFWAKNARVSLLVRMELHVALQGGAADEALVTEITGQWAVPLPPMEAQVLVQFVLFPEGFPALQTFKRPEGLPDKQMLKSCISDAFGPAHVIRCQSSLGRQYSLFLLWLQVQGVRFWFLLQRRWGFLWQLGDWDRCLFWLIQSVQGSWLSLIELLLCPVVTLFPIFTGDFQADKFWRTPGPPTWAKSPLASTPSSTSCSGKHV